VTHRLDDKESTEENRGPTCHLAATGGPNVSQAPHQATHQLNIKLSDEEYARVQVVRERLQPHLADSDPSYQVTNHDVFLQALIRLERRLDKLEKKEKKGRKSHTN
jgi:hypothetical protein